MSLSILSEYITSVTSRGIVYKLKLNIRNSHSKSSCFLLFLSFDIYFIISLLFYSLAFLFFSVDLAKRL